MHKLTAIGQISVQHSEHARSDSQTLGAARLASDSGSNKFSLRGLLQLASDMVLSQTIFYGGVITPEDLTSFKALPNCLLAVDGTGTIEWMIEHVLPHELQDTLALKGCVDIDIVVLQTGEFLLPGLIDTHAHAPQHPNLGCGQEYELLDWLDKITFPMEAKFSDVDFARTMYNSVVRRVIDCGTTTCCYYGSLHLEATKTLVDIVNAYGQRAFIGKCNMDRNCPEHYVETSAETSVKETKELITYIRSLPSSSGGEARLIQPVITPRFAISCTPELLKSLGELASTDPTLRIQTHISENKSEIQFTKELFPNAPNYTSVYDSFGLVRENTILAHAVYLEDAEVGLIARRKAAISHCPTSNFNLRSGISPIGRYLDRGIKVGLGTDFSGGFSSSLLRTIQDASFASKVIALQAGNTGSTFGTKFENRQLTVATLLHLATLGGAQVCGVDKVVGSFEPGKIFDALVVNTRDSSGNPCLWYTGDDIAGTREGLRELLERFFFCGDDRNISRVYVQGRLIGGTAHRT